jgi:hypothetical protein
MFGGDERSKLIAQMVTKIPRLGADKKRYPLWKSMFEMVTAMSPMNRIVSEAHLPKMALDTDEAKKSARERIKMEVDVMQVIRAHIYVNSFHDLQTEITQLEGWSAEEAFIEMKDESKDVVRQLMNEFCTKVGDRWMMDKMAHVSVVVAYIHKRMSNLTPFGKSLTLEALMAMRKDGNERYEVFAARVKSTAQQLRDAGVTVDDLLVRAVLTNHMPAHAQAVVVAVRSDAALTINDIVERMANHFEDMSLDERRMMAEQTNESPDEKYDSTTQVLAVQSSFETSRDGGGQQVGRGRGHGHGLGGGRGGKLIGPKCYKCGKLGHKKAECRSGPKTTQDKQSAKKSGCSYCGGRHHTEDKCYKKAYEDLKKVTPSSTETHMYAISVCNANSTAPASKTGVQLDNAADEHICGDVCRFIQGSLTKLNEPLKICGVGGSSLTAQAKGNILLVLNVDGVRVETVIHNVLFVDGYVGPLILSLGKWTKTGYKYLHEGCINDRAGKLFILHNEQLMMSATQKGGSERLYVDLWDQNSNMNAPATRKVGTVCVSETCAAVSDGVFVQGSSSHSPKANGKDVGEASGISKLPTPAAPRTSCCRAVSACVKKDGHREQGVVFGNSLNKLVDAFKTLEPEIQQAKQEALLKIVHKKLGHACKEACVETLRSSGICLYDKKVGDTLRECQECVVGKFKNVGHHGRRDASDVGVGEEWSFDTFGPMQKHSLGGAQYFGVLACRRSRYVFIVFAKKKDDIADRILEKLKLIKNYYNKSVRILRSDNAGEYRVLSEYCKEQGIREVKTVAGESEQNGQAERLIGVITAQARTIRLAAGAALGFWAECCAHACWLYNRTPHFCLGWRTPLFLFTGETYVLDKLAPFGCAVYFSTKDCNKMGAQAELGIFLGYDPLRDGMRVWSVQQRKALSVWSVKVYESEFPWRTKRHDVCDEYDVSDVFSSSQSASMRNGVSLPQVSLERMRAEVRNDQGVPAAVVPHEAPAPARPLESSAEPSAAVPHLSARPHFQLLSLSLLRPLWTMIFPRYLRMRMRKRGRRKGEQAQGILLKLRREQAKGILLKFQSLPHLVIP